MADTPKQTDTPSSASISEDISRKERFLDKYKNITLNDASIEVLMDPSTSSVITYVKPGVIEKRVVRYKDKTGNSWKEIHKVVVNEKQKVIFVEKRYKNHQYVVSHRRRWSDGYASQWVMEHINETKSDKD